APSAQAQADLAAVEAERAQPPVTRSDNRAAADPLKKDTLSLGAGNTMSRTESLSDDDPQDIARALLATYGWSESQFGCLDSLWTRESNWNIHAANPSGAYGIPQALPGSKMASAGPDWENNAATQIKWGLEYIKNSYGTPCGAWSFKQGHNWY
ncbi:MAG TPA: lytic transglycosylase domain-containing protein, partial [Nocardioidaceae bacterium]|nr:lytic transglycosylase domain-containing protein [Nocardioidaceae bacterium]